MQDHGATAAPLVTSSDSHATLQHTKTCAEVPEDEDHRMQSLDSTSAGMTVPDFACSYLRNYKHIIL